MARLEVLAPPIFNPWRTPWLVRVCLESARALLHVLRWLSGLLLSSSYKLGSNFCWYQFFFCYMMTWWVFLIGDRFTSSGFSGAVFAPSGTFEPLFDTSRALRRRYKWCRKTAHQPEMNSSPRIAATRMSNQSQFKYQGTENGAGIDNNLKEYEFIILL